MVPLLMCIRFSYPGAPLRRDATTISDFDRRYHTDCTRNDARQQRYASAHRAQQTHVELERFPQYNESCACGKRGHSVVALPTASVPFLEVALCY